MTAYITRIKIIVIKIINISLLPLRIGSDLSTTDIILLRKGQDVRSIPLKDLVHSTKFSPSNIGYRNRSNHL